MALARREGKRASAHVEKRSAMSKKGTKLEIGDGRVCEWDWCASKEAE